MNEFWQHCSALLERELTPQQYVTWIKPLAPVAFDAAANTLSIAAPNRFKLDWVKSQFSGRISDLARDYWQAPVEVQFVLDPKAGMRAAVGAASVPLPRVPASVAASLAANAGLAGAGGPDGASRIEAAGARAAGNVAGGAASGAGASMRARPRPRGAPGVPVRSRRRAVPRPIRCTSARSSIPCSPPITS